MANPLSNITLPYQMLLSFGLAQGARPALEPFAQSLTNEAWSAHAVLPPPALDLALGVAQGQVAKADAYGWAKEQGYDTAQMDAMVSIANVGMPLGNAYQAWRRGDLTDGQFQTQLRRLGIESAWWPMLQKLKTDRLDLGAIATAVHRGIMSDSGLLVTPVPTGTGKIPRIPQSSLDTLAEFAAQGIDPERARVLVADTGLPLALGQMLQLLNRNQVTETDVKVSIAESNIRNEYMDAALHLARHLLTPHEYAEAELRGVMSPADAKDGASLSGLNGADYDTLFAILGRPLAIHQITTGLARGGTYGGDYSDVPAGPYRDAIRRSAVRPEYANLDYHNRFTYPSLFQISRLVTSGTIGAATGSDWAHKSGLAPEVVTALEQSWGGGGATGDAHVKKAQTQLWTTTHRSYVAREISATTATTALQAAGVDPASIPAVLALWDEERSLIRKQLSAAQIKKEWFEQITDPTTGAPLTQAQAVARLMELGYDQADATILLEE